MLEVWKHVSVREHLGLQFLWVFKDELFVKFLEFWVKFKKLCFKKIIIFIFFIEFFYYIGLIEIILFFLENIFFNNYNMMATIKIKFTKLVRFI